MDGSGSPRREATVDNLSHHALDLNADAIAYAIYLYASGGEVINQG